MKIFLIFLTCLTYSKAKYVDLTYALNKDAVMWPGRVNTFHTEMEAELPDGTWVASKGFCISEHTATHIDAPYHFYKHGGTLDTISLDKLLDVPGVCIDIYDKVQGVKGGQGKINANYVLTKEDILEWEEKNGQIPPKAVVLVRTGWSKRWPNVYDYLGIPKEHRTTTEAPPAEEEKNDTLVTNPVTKLLNFPGIDATAAVFLTTERQVNGVGIDAIGIDAGNARTFPAHKIFARRSVYMLENVANLHLLPARGFQVFVVPFKVDSGTGSPTRVVAKLP
jgi:kynurenine formamidase